MTIIRTLLCISSCVTALLAQPVPRYEVKRAAAPVVIDGNLNDKAWEAASPAVALQFLWENQTGPKQKTAVRLLWDDQFLYVGYDCEDADITSQFLERDDPTYRDDAVEIFINPRPAQTGLYFGLEMNARAVLYDYLMYDSRFAMKRFNMQGIKLAVLLRGTLNVRGDKDEGWSLEVAIPWVNFEEFSPRPPAGTVWKANLNRWDGVEPERRMSIWSDPQQPQPRPHIPARFGELVFVP
jgi:cellulose/xylan binding protein with CBM9 domain